MTVEELMEHLKRCDPHQEVQFSLIDPNQKDKHGKMTARKNLPIVEVHTPSMSLVCPVSLVNYGSLPRFHEDGDI